MGYPGMPRHAWCPYTRGRRDERHAWLRAVGVVVVFLAVMVVW